GPGGDVRKPGESKPSATSSSSASLPDGPGTRMPSPSSHAAKRRARTSGPRIRFMQSLRWAAPPVTAGAERAFVDPAGRGVRRPSVQRTDGDGTEHAAPTDRSEE